MRQVFCELMLNASPPLIRTKASNRNIGWFHKIILSPMYGNFWNSIYIVWWDWYVRNAPLSINLEVFRNLNHSKVQVATRFWANDPIIPKPELSGFGGDSLTFHHHLGEFPRREQVVIICPCPRFLNRPRVFQVEQCLWNERFFNCLHVATILLIGKSGVPGD